MEINKDIDTIIEDLSTKTLEKLKLEGLPPGAALFCLQLSCIRLGLALGKDLKEMQEILKNSWQVAAPIYMQLHEEPKLEK